MIRNTTTGTFEKKLTSDTQLQANPAEDMRQAPQQTADERAAHQATQERSAVLERVSWLG
jgi:hypothetical protein